jgi:hypothetical protein
LIKYTCTYTGDKVLHDAWDKRFEHPARTWSSASRRSFTLQATGVAMANATYTPFLSYEERSEHPSSYAVKCSVTEQVI